MCYINLPPWVTAVGYCIATAVARDGQGQSVFKKSYELG
jgi:hypothetical protein